MRVSAIALLCLAVTSSACETKKKPPPPVPSSEPVASATPKVDEDDDEDEDEKPKVIALPPGVTALPDAAPAPEAGPPRTGVCTFSEQSFDGPGVRSNEKFIVKVKDDLIVSASYTYRGSHSADAKAENLSVPFQERKWMELKLSGNMEFKFRVKDDVLDIKKGTANENVQGECSFEDTERKGDKRRMRKR